MAVTDRRRREIHDALRAAHGDPVADDMMELLPPVGWGDVARQSDMIAIRGEIAELRGELKDEIAKFRGEMLDRFDMIERRFGKMEGRFGVIEGRFGEMEGRFGKLEGQIAELKGTVQRQIAGLIAAQVVLYVGLIIALLLR